MLRLAVSWGWLAPGVPEKTPRLEVRLLAGAVPPDQLAPALKFVAVLAQMMTDCAGVRSTARDAKATMESVARRRRVGGCTRSLLRETAGRGEQRGTNDDGLGRVTTCCVEARRAKSNPPSL